MRRSYEVRADSASLLMASRCCFFGSTIKSITRRPYRTEQHSHATWYEPLSDAASIENAVHWVLGQEGIFLNTAGDLHVLPVMLEAASNFKHRTSDDLMEKMVTELAMEPLFVERQSSSSSQ